MMKKGLAECVTVAGTGMAIFGLFVPGITELREEETTPAKVEDVHHGELIAGAMVVALGAAMSSATDSPYPFYTAIGICIIMAWALERGLDTPSSDVRNKGA